MWGLSAAAENQRPSARPDEVGAHKIIHLADCKEAILIVKMAWDRRVAEGGIKSLEFLTGRPLAIAHARPRNQNFVCYQLRGEAYLYDSNGRDRNVRWA